MSYTIDRVSIECGLTHDLHNEAIAVRRVHKWTYRHPIPGGPPIMLNAPLLKNGKPRIVGTDSKHLKKNVRGSTTSGARVLVLGQYIVHYSMLKMLAESANSLLLRSDIIDIDKQDDRACTQLLSSATIRQISLLNDLRSELGLTIFLWNVREAVNAQQSRTIPHLERIKMLWHAQFFFDSWWQYVLL
ncbi:hypothetical protein PILCRDRAFT_5304 [Piloderma croceum F 1598]|uniref:Uncharacterized protein n=1 Tax=Piloderma croceum (strain F 1598) TaxID=765440 RepID=A0A0C3C7J8_PILCF|nr:hypothetical protein PILCRDRAFT_5304 [Piloderma croceum F 1598]